MKRPKPVSRAGIYVDTFEKLEKTKNQDIKSSSVAGSGTSSYRSFQGFTLDAMHHVGDKHGLHCIKIVLRSKMTLKCLDTNFGDLESVSRC